MNFVLRDRNPDVVKAWKTVFDKEENFDCQEGEFFEAKADTILIPGNSFGFMSSSILKTIEKEIPCEARIRSVLNSEDEGLRALDELLIGDSIIFETADPIYRHLILAPIQRVPGEDISGSVNVFLAFRSALRELVDRPMEMDIQTILIPGMGTGAGMNPFVSAMQMYKAYVETMLLSPPSLTTAEETIEYHNSLKGKKGTTVLLEG